MLLDTPIRLINPLHLFWAHTSSHISMQGHSESVLLMLMPHVQVAIAFLFAWTWSLESFSFQSSEKFSSFAFLVCWLLGTLNSNQTRLRQVSPIGFLCGSSCWLTDAWSSNFHNYASRVFWVVIAAKEINRFRVSRSEWTQPRVIGNSTSENLNRLRAEAIQLMFQVKI